MKDASNNQSETSLQFLRPKDFIRLLRIGRSTFYTLKREGYIPEPIYISTRTAVWETQEVDRMLRAIQKGYSKDQLQELSIQIKEDRSSLNHINNS